MMDDYEKMNAQSEWSPCDYAVPLASRAKICHWHIERPNEPVPEGAIELNPAKPLKKNSFALAVLPEEKDAIPGIGQYVFIEPGSVQSGDVAAVIESHNVITLISVRQEPTGTWCVDAAHSPLRTTIDAERIVGRVVGSIE
ncbi:hypothetical protein [Halomonas sp. KO116]|uniref:hypothetical protein n=1 Tax=Halomonas sp. KO116 TaxID=1504981 RepID=UPI0004E3FF6C|nr:hypothetical protein [Halomonas sp. KO116]AJY53298.1 hypothetical protein KO116_P200191 [Halomonas sp. KO116]